MLREVLKLIPEAFVVVSLVHFLYALFDLGFMVLSALFVMLCIGIGLCKKFIQENLSKYTRWTIAGIVGLIVMCTIAFCTHQYVYDRPQLVNLDLYVKNCTLKELVAVVGEKENVTFTPVALYYAFNKNDYDTMEYLRTEWGAYPCTGILIDIATQAGDLKMVRYLVEKHNNYPSLFAKQVASIENHTAVVGYIETYVPYYRNRVCIRDVYYDWKNDEWAYYVPETHRY